MKRFFSLFLALVLCLSLVPLTALASENAEGMSAVEPEDVVGENRADGGKCGNNLTWTLDDAGTLTISGTGDMADYYVDRAYVSTPWYYIRWDVKSVVVKQGVTSIGDYAFDNCTELTSVTLPSGVTSIGKYAFYSCESLKTITIPKSVTEIGDYAFLFCFRNSGGGSIHYGGSIAQWKNINVGVSNDGLTNAVICYNYSDAPKITTQPTAKTVAAGANVTFKVSATGVGLKYQWQKYTPKTKTWTDCSGTSASYKFTAKSSYSGYKYRCIVKDSAGNKVTSNAVTLTVTTPKITTQPTSKSVVAGKTVTFTVRATGTGLTYQWQKYTPKTKTWTDCSGTSASYKFTAKSSYSGYKYRCIVKDSAGNKVISNAVTLTVK